MVFKRKIIQLLVGLKTMNTLGKSKFPFSAIIATTSLMVALIALIPAFLSLNKEKPKLYYSYKITHYDTPGGINAKLFDEFLAKNNIPKHRFSLQIKNCGNAPAKEIKFSATSPGQIVRYVFTPSKIEKPPWVDVPDDRELGFGSGKTSVSQTVKNLAANRLLVFGIGYEGNSENIPHIEVFGDGREATFISNISEAPLWNPYRVFHLPGYILAGGLALTLLWIIGSVVFSSEEYRNLFKNIGASVLDSFLESLPLAGALYSSMKRELKKTEQGHGEG